MAWRTFPDVRFADGRTKPSIPSSSTSLRADRSGHFRTDRTTGSRDRRRRGAGPCRLDLAGSDQPHVDQRHPHVPAAGGHRRGDASGRYRPGGGLEEPQLRSRPDRAGTARLAGVRGPLGYLDGQSGRYRRGHLAERLPGRTGDDGAHRVGRDPGHRQAAAGRDGRGLGRRGCGGLDRRSARQGRGRTRGRHRRRTAEVRAADRRTRVRRRRRPPRRRLGGPARRRRRPAVSTSTSRTSAAP